MALPTWSEVFSTSGGNAGLCSRRASSAGSMVRGSFNLLAANAPASKVRP